jgi:hypothetical protein
MAPTQNGQVQNRRHAPHRDEHECGGSISLIAEIVQIWRPTGPAERPLVSFYVPVARLKY